MRPSPFSVCPRSSAVQTRSLPGQRAAPWAKAFFGKEKQNFKGKNTQQLGLDLWFFLSENEHVILCYLLKKPSPLMPSQLGRGQSFDFRGSVAGIGLKEEISSSRREAVSWDICG